MGETIRDLALGPPPELKQFIGETVRWCAVSDKEFLFICGAYMVGVSAAPPPAGYEHYPLSLSFAMGRFREGCDLDAVVRGAGRLASPTEEAAMLVGLPFEGMSGNILRFGARQGVLINYDGVRFMMYTPSSSAGKPN